MFFCRFYERQAIAGVPAGMCLGVSVVGSGQLLLSGKRRQPRERD